MTRARTLSLFLLPLLGGWTAGGPGLPTHGPAPHSIRMSMASLEIGEATLDLRVRFFWDDLQIAIMESRSDMDFRLAENSEVDLVVQDYINDMLVLEVGGRPLRGRVIGRGVEDAARRDEVMWWYRIEYATEATPERVYIKNRLLFNMFEDQRNIVHVKLKTGKERAYYFSWDEEDVTVPLG